MKKNLFILISVAVFILSGVHAFAASSDKIMEVINKVFMSADPHKALNDAYAPPDMSKIHSFVVIEKGGIPAERAEYYISWGNYDYRGVKINTSKDDELTTRRGDVYTYLQRGDVMNVIDVSRIGRTIYFKLMSNDVYVPENRKNEKHHSRVTVTLEFEFSKDFFTNDNEDAVLAKISEWIKPFGSLGDAKEYSEKIKASKAQAAASAPSPAPAAKTPASKAPASSKPANAKAPDVSDQDAAIKALEDKINGAKREMEEAEKQLEQIKKQ